MMEWEFDSEKMIKFNIHTKREKKKKEDKLKKKYEWNEEIQGKKQIRKKRNRITKWGWE